MQKIGIALVLATAFLSQPLFAGEDMTSDSKPCNDIAKACLDAGYTRDSTDKRFWQDCMRPLLLGKSVDGVTVDAATVKTCRSDKITQLKKEISDLQKAKSK